MGERSRIENCPACSVDLVVRRTQFRITTRTLCFDLPGYGTVAWKCPDCDYVWHRWPVGTELWIMAAPWVYLLNREPLPPNEDDRLDGQTWT